MTELSVIRKTTNTFTLTIKENGVAKNITGFTIFFTVKKNTSQTDTQAVISKTITSHSNPTHGITLITLSPTDTNIQQGTYVYDIRYKDLSNNIYAIPQDNFTILDYVTQRTS